VAPKAAEGAAACADVAIAPQTTAVSVRIPPIAGAICTGVQTAFILDAD
jgi:hypothetical protein